MAESNKNSYRAILGLLATVCGIVAGFFIIIQVVDWRIKATVNNSEFIRKIASHVRPYIIFDTNETILVDGGGLQYLHGKLKIIPSNIDSAGAGHYQFIVTPKDYLHQAPMIEALCGCNFAITSQRGKGIEWTYEIDALGWSDHWKENEKPAHQFRLEIIR